MLVPVAILTVLAAVSGWIQFQPFWDPITHWLSSVVPTDPAAEATNWDDAVMSVLAPILGIGGSAGPRRVHRPRRRPPPPTHPRGPPPLPEQDHLHQGGQ